MIKNSTGIYQLYPIVWCKFQRVLWRVEYRLKNNIFKNFGIQYEDTDHMRCLFYKDGAIDFNFTKAMFHTKNGKASLSVFDEKTNPYENNLSGECIPAYTYEKLVFNYWGLNSEIYTSLPENDEKRILPDSFRYDWEGFKELYNRTFNSPIGDDYDIICSSGIQRI